MKSRFIKTLIIAAAFALIIPASSFAKMQITLGTDAIRLVDQAQFEGMLNIYFQGDITKSSAFVIAVSNSSLATVIDGSYRHYFDKYHNGKYIDAGATIVLMDDDNDVGAFVQYGYEMSPAKHFIVGVGVRMIIGYEHPMTQENDPIFLPVLNLGFAF